MAHTLCGLGRDVHGDAKHEHRQRLDADEAGDFGLAVTEVEWIVNAYLLATEVLLLTFGRLGDVIGYRKLIGFGPGVSNSLNQSAIIGSVPRQRLGTASGTIAQMRITGQVLGVAASGAILSARIPDHIHELSASLSEAAARSEAVILAVHEALYFSATVALLGMLGSLARRR